MYKIYFIFIAFNCIVCACIQYTNTTIIFHIVCTIYTFRVIYAFTQISFSLCTIYKFTFTALFLLHLNACKIFLIFLRWGCTYVLDSIPFLIPIDRFLEGRSRFHVYVRTSGEGVATCRGPSQTNETVFATQFRRFIRTLCKFPRKSTRKQLVHPGTENDFRAGREHGARRIRRNRGVFLMI